MSDVFDLFGVEVGTPTYGGTFWLYGSTNGIISLGGLFRSEAEAERALRDFAQEPLAFKEVRRDATYASTAYKNKLNLAVVTCRDRILREAQLPPGWFPPGDPRRAGTVGHQREDGQ